MKDDWQKLTQKAIQNYLLTAENVAYVTDICRPLNKLKINSFFYTSFFNKQRDCLIGTGIQWLNYQKDNVFKHKTYFGKQFHYREGYSITLLEMLEQGKPTLDMHAHNMKSAIYLTNVSSNSEYTETFIFTTPYIYEQGNKLLIESLPILNNFCLYFKDKAHKIIQKNRILSLSNKQSLSLENKIISSVSQNNIYEIKKYYLGHPYDHIYFTEKQFLIIKDIIYGFTIKEIGKKFGVSHRTIEKQIELMKTKVNVKTKHELFKIVFRSNIFCALFNL